MPLDLLADKLDWPALALLLLLIVFPGLVSMRIFRLFAAAREIDWHSSLYESAFWGTVNLLFACFCLFVIGISHYCLGFFHFFEKWFEYFTLVLPIITLVGGVSFLTITAILLPIIWLLFREIKFVKKYILCQQPTAWDYYFSSGQSCFILAHLKNGDLIGGYYGERSFASSSPDKMNIYIEKVISIDENGNFGSYTENSNGLLLREDDFEYLEFFSVSDNSILQNENQKEIKNEEHSK